MSKNPISTRVLTHCAILIALGVVIARLFSLTPNEFSRFSIESIPIFLSGMLFGPIAGAMVGFSTDFIGCLLSPWGFNPLFSLPPILYGVCGGIFRHFLGEKISVWRFALSLLPAIVLGSVAYFVVHKAKKKAELAKNEQDAPAEEKQSEE